MPSKFQYIELSQFLSHQIKSYELRKTIGYINDNWNDFINSDLSRDLIYKCYNQVISTDTKRSLKDTCKMSFKKMFKRRKKK